MGSQTANANANANVYFLARLQMTRLSLVRLVFWNVLDVWTRGSSFLDVFLLLPSKWSVPFGWLGGCSKWVLCKMNWLAWCQSFKSVHHQIRKKNKIKH